MRTLDKILRELTAIFLSVLGDRVLAELFLEEQVAGVGDVREDFLL